jgi:hypothetical protein
MLWYRRKLLHGFPTEVTIAAFLVCVAAFVQDNIPPIDPLPESSGRYSNGIMMGLGPSQTPDQLAGAGASALAFFTTSYSSLGTTGNFPSTSWGAIRQMALSRPSCLS